MPKPPIPTPKVTFDPTPSAWHGGAQFVAARLREMFIDDLWRSGFPRDLAELIRKRTKIGRSWIGGSFRPYSPSYVKAGQTPDLTVTGDLLDSLTPKRDKEGVAIVPEGPHKGTRTAALLALFHEGGTRAGRRHGTSMRNARQRLGRRKKGGSGGMPARPFMGFTDADEVMIQGVMAVIFSSVTASRIEALLASTRLVA